MLATASVHTTGFNWDGIASISIVVSALVGILIVPTMHYISSNAQRSNRHDMEVVIDEKVTPRFDAVDRRLDRLESNQNEHHARLARLEGVEAGKNIILATQAGARHPAGES